MNRNHRMLAAWPVLFVAIALIGTGTMPATAQQYKEDYNTALEAAKTDNFSEARASFAAAAKGADTAGDADIARKSRYIAAQLDYKMGTAALREKKYEDALGHYEAGSAIFPDYIKNRYGQGLALKNLDRAEEAIPILKEVGDADGDRKTSLAAINTIREYFYFQASSAVSKTNATANDADLAVAALNEAAKYVDPDADYHYYMSVVHRIKGNPDACVSSADEALALHKGSRADKAKIWFVKGEALISLGNIDGAKSAFQNATFGSYRPSAEYYLETL